MVRMVGVSEPMSQKELEMNLVTSHSKSLTIKLFGSSGGTTQVCDMVDLCISVDGDDDVKLSAVSVPLTDCY